MQVKYQTGLWVEYTCVSFLFIFFTTIKIELILWQIDFVDLMRVDLVTLSHNCSVKKI